MTDLISIFPMSNIRSRDGGFMGVSYAGTNQCMLCIFDTATSHTIYWVYTKRLQLYLVSDRPCFQANKGSVAWMQIFWSTVQTLGVNKSTFLFIFSCFVSYSYWVYNKLPKPLFCFWIVQIFWAEWMVSIIFEFQKLLLLLLYRICWVKSYLQVL